MAIAGHVSPKMLAHYSHVRMDAKRKALDALSSTGAGGSYDTKHDTNALPAATSNPQVVEINCRPVGTRNQLPENRCQQLGRIGQQLKTRTGHEWTLDCEPNRVQPNSALARAHPESHRPGPEVDKAQDRVTLPAERSCREARAPRLACRLRAKAKLEAGRSRRQFHSSAARLHTR
jgi:hypothetical protein